MWGWGPQAHRCPTRAEAGGRPVATAVPAEMEASEPCNAWQCSFQLCNTQQCSVQNPRRPGMLRGWPRRRQLPPPAAQLAQPIACLGRLRSPPCTAAAHRDTPAAPQGLGLLPRETMRSSCTARAPGQAALQCRPGGGGLKRAAIAPCRKPLRVHPSRAPSPRLPAARAARCSRQQGVAVRARMAGGLEGEPVAELVSGGRWRRLLLPAAPSCPAAASLQHGSGRICLRDIAVTLASARCC